MSPSRRGFLAGTGGVLLSGAVGGALLGGGKGSVVGTVAGVLIIGFLQNIMNLLQLPGDLQYVAVGLVIVAAVALQQVRRRA